MKKASAWGMGIVLLACGPSALAGLFDYEFTVTDPMGGPFELPDNNIKLIYFPFDDPNIPGKDIPNIETIELELTGLTHSYPDDLDIFLIDPDLNSIKIMGDNGGSHDVNNVTLVFNDSALGMLPDDAQIVAGTYRPEGLVDGTDGGFADLYGPNTGSDQWVLAIVDDAAGDVGTLQSFTLRGTVPEPASLSLLALGAVAAAARKRRDR